MRILITIFLFIFIFTYSVNAQTYAKIIQGNHPNIKYFLDKNDGDTLKIVPLNTNLRKVQIIHSESLHINTFNPNKHKIKDTFIIPLIRIKQGWNTVVSYDTDGNLNVFRLYKE